VDYSRFERLAIGVGVIAVIGTATLSLVSQVDPIELAAQLLLLAVLVAAVRWGRRGGTLAGIGAMVAYVALRSLTIPTQGITALFVTLLAARTIAYLSLGVLGGEACDRIRVAFALAKDARAFDESSAAYTPKFLSRRITESVSSYERYNEVFSVVVIGVDGRAIPGAKSAHATEMVTSIVDRLRAGLRLVDEVGRLPWGAYALVLPHTASAGAHVVADRLRADLREGLGIADESITLRVLTAGDDLDAIRTLAAESAQEDPVL
jgi:GGDEF domain-containing protein